MSMKIGTEFKYLRVRVVTSWFERCVDFVVWYRRLASGISERKCQGRKAYYRMTSIERLKRKVNTVELCYNVMKGTEYFVSL
jgi:hypothetical protein